MQNIRKKYLPIPHLSHNTISFGLSEVPSLQMIHTISAVVSVTVKKQKVALARTKRPNYTFPMILRKGSFIERENKNSLIASHMKTEGENPRTLCVIHEETGFTIYTSLYILLN